MRIRHVIVASVTLLHWTNLKACRLHAESVWAESYVGANILIDDRLQEVRVLEPRVLRQLDPELWDGCSVRFSLRHPSLVLSHVLYIGPCHFLLRSAC